MHVSGWRVHPCTSCNIIHSPVYATPRAPLQISLPRAPLHQPLPQAPLSMSPLGPSTAVSPLGPSTSVSSLSPSTVIPFTRSLSTQALLHNIISLKPVLFSGREQCIQNHANCSFIQGSSCRWSQVLTSSECLAIIREKELNKKVEQQEKEQKRNGREIKKLQQEEDLGSRKGEESSRKGAKNQNTARKKKRRQGLLQRKQSPERRQHKCHRE